MFSWRSPRTKPLLIAHRGASAAAPENTLAAFQRAIRDGADAIELDVHLTKDGEVVVIHDSSLRRTTDGTGRVEDQSLARLRRYSAGRWFHPTFAAETIPTLEEVLRLVDGRVGINIEIKFERMKRKPLTIVERCLQIVAAHHAESIVLISSFHHPCIKHVKKLRPEIMTGALLHPFRSTPGAAVSISKRLDAEYLILSGSMLRKSAVIKAHGENICVGEYTVNTERRAERACRYGVDAVFTNEPAAMVSLIK